MSLCSRETAEVGVITLWYRSAHAIERFASNLEEIVDPRPRVVFVIQDQTAEVVQRLRARVPRAVILEPGANLGTAAGWNLGIQRLLESGTRYVAMWNVDVRLDRDCLRRLVAVMDRDSSIGACQPLLLYSDEPGKVQMFGGSYDVTTGAGRHDYQGATALDQLPALRDAEYVDGGSMLVRAHALRAAGGFDERLFMYAEDAELCYRLRRRGYRTVAVRDARAWHHHREERGVLPAPYQLFYETRNRLYLVLKLAGWQAGARLATRLALGLPRQFRYYQHERRPLLAWPYLMGLMYGVGCRMGKQGWVR
jgi:GT2 family glycosyltransferase